MDVTWEYKTLSVDLEAAGLSTEHLDEKLNSLGEARWELLAVAPVLQNNTTVALIYHLRRTADTHRRAGFNQ